MKKNLFTKLHNKKLPIKLQSSFLVQTANMLENGFSLQQAIDFQMKVTQKHTGVFHEMIAELKQGKAFYEALSNQAFNPHICAQIYFASKHGFLSTTLKDAGMYLAQKEFERRKLLTLLYYPIILFAVLIMIGLFMEHFLFPQFQSFYHSLGVKENNYLQILLHFTNHFSFYLLLFLLLLFLLLCTYQILKHKMLIIDRTNMLAKIPIFSTLYVLYQTGLFAREWGLLFKSGFSIKDILSMMEDQSFQKLFKDVASEIKLSIYTGYSLSDSIESFDFLTKELKIIIAHGEMNNQLGEELLYFSSICLQQMEEKMLRLFQVVQPMLFISIGLLVIGMYLSIFIPIFQVIDSI